MEKFREAPIHLININNSGFFEMTSEGSEFLSMLSGKKLCTVSITGPYRSGKSFLANLLMNSMSGFKTGSTTNACTKGLWIWGKPFQIDKDTFLLIIDSEGLGSVEKDRELNIDLKIFTLCVLASSVLIYNSKHAINEEKIEELANVANLSNRIKFKAINNDQSQIDNNSSNNEKERIISFFPKLIWILRDFSLDLKGISSNQYLEQCLSTNESSSSEKLESREIIKKNFRNRECYTLVIPSNDKKKIQNLEFEDISVIRKEFIEEIEKLVERIKTDYIVKCFNGVELDGMTFLGILQHFIESLNNNEAPVIFNSLENVLLAKSSKKQEEYFERFKALFMFSEVQTIKENKVYKQITKMELPINLNEIISNYFENLSKIQMDFSKSLPSSFSPEQVGSYQNKLFTRTQVEFYNCIETNYEYMEAWIDLEFSNIIKILNNTITNNFKVNISKESDDYFIELEKPDDLVKYCFIVTQEISHQLLTKLNFFPDKFTSKVLEKFSKLIEINVFNKLKNMTKNLNEKVQQVVTNLQEERDRYAITSKNLKEQIINEKRLVEEIKKEKNEIYLSKIEIESKYENLLRDMRNKEREFTNNISIESQKYIRMEGYYTNSLKEKNSQISDYELKLAELKKYCSRMEKELSDKKIEFNKESSILSLKVEIERLKSQNKGVNNISSQNNVNNSTIDDENNNKELKSNKEYASIQISNVLKQIQSLCLEFKEEIDKFDKEKESVFRKKIFEITDKELEKRSNSFIDDINLIKETLFDEYKSNFERKNREMSVEISDLKLKINQLELTIIEEKSTIDYYKNKINSFEKQLQESKNTCQSKDSLIEMLKEQLSVFELKQKEWLQCKDDFEVKIYEIGSALKIKDDEIDTIIMLIDSILSKNKKKYDNQIYSLDDEIKITLNKLIVEYKIFK